MKSGNRVILNTAILYAKMAISISVGLISTRLTLEALGIEDYGIFNLVAGIVSMLTFLNTSLAASTQRFLSFALGQGSSEYLCKIFYYSLVLHLFIGLCVIALIETIGIYCIQHVLTIEPTKLSNTLTILHLLSGSIFFSIMSVPYIAVLVSRENMFLLSLIEIVEIMLKLLGVLYLSHYNGNRLILYSVVIVCATFLSLILRIIMCWRKYPETTVAFGPLKDKPLLWELTSFAGWYTFASVGSIGRFQGIPILLNVFFGVIVNAAYGIANQVNGLMQSFATAILQSIRPQIIKSEGASDRERAQKLSQIACRYMFYLCAFFSIPLMIEMPCVLHLWLKETPEYSVGFCRLILASTLLYMITCGLTVAIDATGHIKWMYIVMGCLHFLNLPVGYGLLKSGMSAYSILWVIVIEELICMCVRIYLAHRIVNINPHRFLKQIVGPIVAITTVTSAIGLFITHYMETSVLRLALTCIACGSTFIVLCWFWGMERTEKQKVIFTAGTLKAKLIR